jgi:hypothetical protein
MLSGPMLSAPMLPMPDPIARGPALPYLRGSFALGICQSWSGSTIVTAEARSRERLSSASS